jgi:hypothetical protein
MNELFTTVAFKPKRKIGSFEATVTLEEGAQDDLEITQHPVQDGAVITDHAYKKPVMLNVSAQYSPLLTGTPIDEMYRRLLILQNNRIPMDVVTGKRVYRNMLIKTLGETTNKETSQILNLSFSLQEIIVTSVVTVTVPATSINRANQAEPGRTGADQNGGIKKAGDIPAQDQPKRQSQLRSLFG